VTLDEALVHVDLAGSLTADSPVERTVSAADWKGRLAQGCMHARILHTVGEQRTMAIVLVVRR